MADGSVNIQTGLETGDIRRDVATLNRELGRIGNNMGRVSRRMTDEFGNSFDSMGRRVRQVYKGTSVEAQRMSAEIRSAYARQREGMSGLRDDMIRVRHGYFKMAEGSKTYQGTTKQFMSGIEELGKKHKKIMDNMMANNEMQKMSFYQSVGAMLARSTQASKISDNFDRMGNPLYKVNKAGLAVAGSLEKIAMRGQPAALALSMLGPTANMKELNDMTRTLQTGIMRITMVAIGAAAASAILYTKIVKAAMGPDPAKVRSRINEINKAYSDSYKSRLSEIANFTGLFEKASLKAVSKASITKALQSQVTSIKTWMTSLASLTKKGVDQGLIKELQKAGPAAAMQIKALDKMSRPELSKYVALWKEKMALANQQTTSELKSLREKADAQIQKLKDSLKPLGVEVEKFKSTWGKALEPFIDMISKGLAKVVSLGTKIGDFFNKMNEVNPILSKIVFSFLALIPALTLILSPLAAGVGLIAGMKLAFGALWMVIKPVVIGLGAMQATTWIVAAAIVGLIAGITYLWKTNESFRSSVISAWNSIKTSALAVWGFIKPYIMQAISAVSTFVQQKLQQIKTFWQQNGQQIMQVISTAWNVIKTIFSVAMAVLIPIFKVGWMILVSIIQSTWEAIKNVINGSINVIMGIVKVFTGLFTGDFSKMWEGIKQIFTGALQTLWGLINLYFVGKLLGPLKGFGGIAKSFLQSVWSFIKGLFTKSLSAIGTGIRTYFNLYMTVIRTIMTSIKTVITSLWNGIRTFITTILNGIKTTVTTIFNGLKTAITSAMNGVKTAITTGWNKAKSFLQGINLTSIGKDIIKGLINGIGSMAGKVVEKVKSVAKGISSAVTKFFGIKSPSRLMMEYGKFISDGLGVGITKNGSKAANAMKNVAKQTEKEFKLSMSFISKKSAAGKVSLSEELQFYNQMLKKFGNNATHRIELEKRIVNTKQKLAKKSAEIEKQSLDSLKSTIDKRKQYNDLSLTQELVLLEKLKAATKKGSKERADAELEIAKVKQQIYDQLKTAQQDYLTKTKEVNSNLIAEEKRLNQEYQSAVDERAKSIYNFIGLFDQVKESAAVSASSLLDNLTGQVGQLETWSSTLSQLASKGIEKGLLSELQAMGPDALPQLQALNTMTNTQLTQFVSLWKTKSNLARQQAVMELDYMKKDTVLKISQLKTEAGVQLNILAKEFNAKIKGIRKGSDSEFNAMKASMPAIGRDIISGLMSGISSMSGALAAQVSSLANSIKSSITGALKIKSPSRWMRDEVGKMIPAGIGVGVQANTGSALSALRGMSDEIMFNTPRMMANAVSPRLASSSGTSAASLQIILETHTYLDGEPINSSVNSGQQKRMIFKNFTKGVRNI